MSEKWLRNVRIETNYLSENEFVYGTESQSVDIQVVDGCVKQIKDCSIHYKAELNEKDIDGKGNLLLPTLREMHCHLDKSKLGTPWRPRTPAKNRIERFTKEMDELEALDLPISNRLSHLIDLEMQFGVTFFRSHIDVHPQVGQRYLEETLKGLERYKEKIDYELVAFPQHGLLLSNAFNEVKKALQNGASLVGGVDPSSIDGNLEKSLHQTFELATEFNVPIDIHVHDREKQGRNTTKKLIELTEDSGWNGKVAISHAFGLNDFCGEERREIFKQLADLNIQIISSIPLGGSVPPISELRQAGVDIRIGCDNIYDSWSPLGRGSVVDKLNRAAEIFQIASQEGLTDIFSMISSQTIDPTKDTCWLKEGQDASFLLTKATSTAEFVARQTPVEMSFFKGKRVL